MLSNIKYMIKNWINWDKKSILYFFIRIPVLVLQPIIIAFVPKAIIDGINNNKDINKIITIIIFLSILITLTTWLEPFMSELIKGSSRIIRMRYAILAFKKNLNAPYHIIESYNTREIYQHCEEFYRSDHSSSTEFIKILNQICICILGIITSLSILYKVDAIIILLIFFTCIIELFSLYILNKRERIIKNKQNIIFSKFNYYYNLSKDNSGRKDLKIYGFSNQFIYIMAHLILDCEKLVANYTKTSISISGTRALLNLFREIIGYVYLVYLVFVNKITISDFIFYFGIITGFSNWIVSLVYYYSSMSRCCYDCQKYRDFIEIKNDSTFNKTNITTVNTIEFKNVNFSYPDSKNSTITNLSFKINKGERIAIVGKNGSGKTTIIKLLCGLYSPTKGEILINGKPQISTQIFSPVFQDYSFLPMTIAENIAVTSEYDKTKLYDAFEKAGILDKIKSLKDKENTYMIKEIYKNAADFSGGEKQKLLLAKAIYKDAPVLILDEPTAALDPIAENELYLKYNELTNDKISFFVSHRLSSTQFCDKIFFIENGEISECGTHEELIKLKKNYYRMYKTQSYYYNKQRQKNE